VRAGILLDATALTSLEQDAVGFCFLPMDVIAIQPIVVSASREEFAAGVYPFAGVCVRCAFCDY
jgi:hypothetical protein